MAIEIISVERRSFAVEILRIAKRTRRVGPIIVGETEIRAVAVVI